MLVGAEFPINFHAGNVKLRADESHTICAVRDFGALRFDVVNVILPDNDMV